MPAIPAADYQEVVRYATRNVWTQYNAGVTSLRDILNGWKNATFALQNGQSPLPPGTILWEPAVLELVQSLPPLADQDILTPWRVHDIIKKVMYSFRDNPALASVEGAYVAVFNSFWT